MWFAYKSFFFKKKKKGKKPPHSAVASEWSLPSFFLCNHWLVLKVNLLIYKKKFTVFIFRHVD